MRGHQSCVIDVDEVIDVDSLDVVRGYGRVSEAGKRKLSLQEVVEVVPVISSDDEDNTDSDSDASKFVR